MKKIIVAIDGPSGSGKSTVAKLLAKKLGYTYIDTGAMYRAIALQAKRDNVDINSGIALSSLCDSVQIGFVPNNDGLSTILNGVDVSEEIRTPEMSMAASDISAKKEALSSRNPEVRGYILVSNKEQLGYLYHYTNQEVTTTTQFELNIPKTGTLIWIDPASGKVNLKQYLEKGQNALNSPPFNIDLAFKIKFE